MVRDCRWPIKALHAAAMLLSGSARAGPDAWVEASLASHLDDGQVTGLSWRFEDYFGARSAENYDSDHNGRIENGEVTRLRSDHFDPL